MKTKEQQAKEYADRIPHYQDRKQHAAEDFLAGWEAAVKHFERLGIKVEVVYMRKPTGCAGTEAVQDCVLS